MAYEEFLGAQSRLRSQAETQKSAAQRLLKQKFSGRLGSGAALGAEQDVNKQIGADLSNQIGALEGQKAQQQAQQRLAEEARIYQKGEREAAQQYGTQERIGSQQFAASESALARALQSDQFEKQLSFQEKEFAENLKNNFFNKLIALTQANPEGLDNALYTLGYGNTQGLQPNKYVGGQQATGGPINARYFINRSGAF